MPVTQARSVADVFALREDVITIERWGGGGPASVRKPKLDVFGMAQEWRLSLLWAPKTGRPFSSNRARRPICKV